MHFKSYIFGGEDAERGGKGMDGWKIRMEEENLEWLVSIFLPASLQASPADSFKEVLTNLVS